MVSIADKANRNTSIELKSKEYILDGNSMVVMDVQSGEIVHLLNCIFQGFPFLIRDELHAVISKQALKRPICASRNSIPSRDKANSIDHAGSPAGCLSGLTGQWLHESSFRQLAIPNGRPTRERGVLPWGRSPHATFP